MMELVNDKKNDNTYVTTSMNWLTIITESFAHFVLGVDDTLSDCFDIYFEKLKPICEESDRIEFEVPFGYYLKDFQKIRCFNEKMGKHFIRCFLNC